MDFKLIKQTINNREVIYLNISKDESDDENGFTDLYRNVKDNVVLYYDDSELIKESMNFKEDTKPNDGEEYVYLATAIEGYLEDINILIKPSGETPDFILNILPSLIKDNINKYKNSSLDIKEIEKEIENLYAIAFKYYLTSENNETLFENHAKEYKLVNKEGNLLTTIEEFSLMFDDMYFESVESKLSDVLYLNSKITELLNCVMVYLTNKPSSAESYNYFKDRYFVVNIPEYKDLVNELIEYINTHEHLMSFLQTRGYTTISNTELLDEHILNELIEFVEEYENLYLELDINPLKSPTSYNLIKRTDDDFKLQFAKLNNLLPIYNKFSYFDLI